MNEEKLKPAIVAVGYNRPDSLKRLLRSLESADYPSDDIDLIVSIDKSSKQQDVIRAADEVPWSHGTRTIRAFDQRQGLRRHVIQCGDLSQKYGAVIILEDDLLVSPSFYHYTFQALNHYYEDDRICGIALYRHWWNGYGSLPFMPCRNEYDTFCGQFSITWGQCWSDRQWRAFKKWYLEKENSLPDQNQRLPNSILHWGSQSWGKYFVSYIVETEKYYVVPYTAMSTNFSEVGQHNNIVDTSYQVPLLEGIKKEYCFPKFDDSIKYDVFFERVFADDVCIAGIHAGDICVNLNGTKPSALGRKYLLSTKKPDREVIASFGISMRPIDSNITQETEGSGIFLSVAPESDNLEVDVKRPGCARESYELFGFYWTTLLREGFRRFRLSVKSKVASELHKMKTR